MFVDLEALNDYEQWGSIETVVGTAAIVNALHRGFKALGGTFVLSVGSPPDATMPGQVAPNPNEATAIPVFLMGYPAALMQQPAQPGQGSQSYVPETAQVTQQAPPPLTPEQVQQLAQLALQQAQQAQVPAAPAPVQPVSPPAEGVSPLSDAAAVDAYLKSKLVELQNIATGQSSGDGETVQPVQPGQVDERDGTVKGGGPRARKSDVTKDSAAIKGGGRVE